MSKNSVAGFVLAAICALSVFLISCGSTSSRPSGALYVLTEGSNGYGDNVSSFSVDLNTGGLSYINSNASTCPTAASQQNPEPCGLPLDILLDPAGSNAFVLNQGTPCVLQNGICEPNSPATILPSIYPFTVNSDGSLSAPGTAVTWTANGYPDTAVAMTRDAAGQFLFVIDQGSYPYPGYPTPSPTNPSCPHNPQNAADVCPSISVFTMNNGTLSLASGSPFYLSKIPTALSALAFTPVNGTAEELLFVTNNLDLCTASCVLPQHSDNTVSVYSVSSSGVLTETTSSPYAIAEADPISVMAVNTYSPTAGNNSGGVFVYVGSEDPNGGHLNPFQVCTSVQIGGCTTLEVQNNLFFPVTCPPQASCSVSPGQSPIQMAVDPTNNFLYVLSAGQNAVYGYSVASSTGKLTALSPASQQTGSAPVSLALHPSVNNTGQFLFVSNSNSNNVTPYTLNTTTGSMSALPTVITPATPSGVAVH
ncbi:MAG: beta-propeller fold lactonase family protein [Terriglobales bacterium]|jgi:hypothetical protein